MKSMVEHGRTGLHFEAGDAEDLAAKVMWAVRHREAWSEMRRAARAEYEAKYTPERNYAMLMEIYERAIGNAGPSTTPIATRPAALGMTDVS